MKVWLALLVAALFATSAAAQDVAPGTAQNGSIQGTTSATCSVYHATGGAIVIAGTWVGTLQFESSVDGVNYLALPVTPQAGGAAVTSTAANGTWNFVNQGYVSPAGVRVRASAWTSGLATTSCTTVGATFLYTQGTVGAIGPGTIDVPNITTTSTDALLLRNMTPASSGVTVQMSPRLRLCGSAYNSVSTLSETDCFFTEVLPATAAGTTTASWRLGVSINGGAAVYPASLSSSGLFTATGFVTTGGNFQGAAGDLFFWAGRAVTQSPADGNWALSNNAQSIGSRLKADALPTIASGFGTTPSITAGSTPLAMAVNVGTGGVATTGVINFNGTAFPSAPFCTATPTTSNVVQRVSSTTTQVTLNVTTAWTASDVIFVQCISPK